MSLIQVNNLTFGYEGSYDMIFENTSFQIDTDWKLGFIGRNGRGKTTFLRLLMGQYPYEGTISACTDFTYFPYVPEEPSAMAWEVVEQMMPDYEYWKLGREMNLLGLNEEVLYRPFNSLSQGERTKILMAGLFVKENSFLLIDEPTNHLDRRGRQIMAEYLKRKKGFILVSHDRWFLDQCIDHVLSINRASITVEKGNFSSWEENMQRRQAFEETQAARIEKDIERMEAAARRTAHWSDKVEKTKKAGRHGVRQAGVKPDKGHVGAKAAALMKRTKETERKQQRSIKQKAALLKDRERADSLRLSARAYRSPVMLAAQDLALYYGTRQVLGPLRFQINQGQRIALTGPNGSGKSSLLNLILAAAAGTATWLPVSPSLTVAAPAIRSAQTTPETLAIRSAQTAPETLAIRSAQTAPEIPAIRSAQTAPETPAIRSAQAAPETLVASGTFEASPTAAGTTEVASADTGAGTDFTEATLGPEGGLCYTGALRVGAGLVISYVPQSTDHLIGSLSDYAKKLAINESQFMTILRKLDFERVHLEKPMESLSQGQKKKVLIAGSLCQSAHLYIWDEPLNYIDVISRMQIEELLLEYKPTMIFVEHDSAFCENVATETLDLIW